MRKEAKPCQKGYFKLGGPESSGNTRGTQEAAVTKSTDGGSPLHWITVPWDR